MPSATLDYFIMLVTTKLQDGTPHSYIALGTKDSEGNISIVKEVGKQLDFDEKRQERYQRVRDPLEGCELYCGLMLKQLFFHEKARLADESYLQHKLYEAELIEEAIEGESKKIKESKKEKKKIEYELWYLAYRISQAQFTRFEENLNRIRDKNATAPVLNQMSEQTYSKTKSRSKRMSVGNTCRNTAVDLLQLGSEHAVSSGLAPRWFLSSLPFKSSISNGSFTSPLVILPLPPSAVSMDENNKEILIKLYQRLERLSIKEARDPIAKRKYEGLKSLYESQISEKDLSLEGLLKEIVEWKGANRELIDTHRGFHFFWQATATRKVINDIESRFSCQPGT